MKRHHFVILIIISFLSFLVFAEIDQNLKVNNSFSKSILLEFDETGAGMLNSEILPKGDRDFFAVNIEELGEYIFKVSSEDPEARFGIRVLDSNNEVIRDWILGEKGKELLLVMDITKVFVGKRIYFEVMQYEDNAEFEYTVSVMENPVSDYTEPNDRFREAFDIELNTVTEAYVFPQGDHDFFKVIIPSAGRFTLRVESEDQNLQMGARILTEENQIYNDWKYAIDAGELCEIVNDFNEKTVLYLEVNHKDDKVKSYSPYTIDVSLFQIDDKYEPNDSFKEAVSVELNDKVIGYLFTLNDSDYFKFSVPQTGLVKFRINAFDQVVRPAFRILTDENLVYNDWVTASEFSNTVELEKEMFPGEYYIELYSSGDYSSVLPYEFEILFEPSTDINELNNDFSTAVEIDDDVVVEGEIFPKGDRDFYKIDVLKPSEMRIILRSNPALSIGVRILDDDNQVVQDWIYASETGDDLYIKTDIQKAGMYYLEVGNLEDTRGIILPYTLTVKIK